MRICMHVFVCLQDISGAIEASRVNFSHRIHTTKL